MLLRYGRYLHLTEGRIKLGQYLFRRHGGKIAFFGRFIAVLRALAALLAGANHMDWPRFLLCNAAGGMVWATLYGGAAYYFGHALEQVTRKTAFGLTAVAAIAIAILLIIARRHEAELQQVAERALPGPLARSRPRDGDGQRIHYERLRQERASRLPINGDDGPARHSILRRSEE